jgi:DNA-binding response OmpR family regulator
MTMNDIPDSPKTGLGRILCVDDDPDILMMLEAALGTYGYDTMLARDGEQGVRFFKDRKAEFVAAILDLKMPDKNGLQVAKEIRAESAKVVLIALSAYLGGTQEGGYLVKQCAEAGFDAYTVKPVPIEELVQIIQDCVRERTQEHTAP